MYVTYVANFLIVVVDMEVRNNDILLVPRGEYIVQGKRNGFTIRRNVYLGFDVYAVINPKLIRSALRYIVSNGSELGIDDLYRDVFDFTSGE